MFGGMELRTIVEEENKRGTMGIRDAKFRMLDEMKLLDDVELRSLHDTTLRALWRSVCGSTCDQFGGYHSDGCHQLTNEFYRRKTLKECKEILAVMEARGTPVSPDDFLTDDLTRTVNFHSWSKERYHRTGEGRPEIFPDFSTLLETSIDNPDAGCRDTPLKKVHYYIAFKAKDEDGRSFWCVFYADAPNDRRAVGNKRFASWKGFVEG
jgi:hypothetical protein